MTPRDAAEDDGARSVEAKAPTAVRTACPYCGVGCGVLATPDGKGGAAIEGDPDHPANFGRLCSKGSALGDTISLEGRLLTPRVDGREAGWDEALDRVATTFRDAIAEHGPDSVAMYVSGQLLTEDYYVANKFMKGYVGSANIDTNSRLCMASSVAGHKRAFGGDVVPGVYEDLEQADLVVLTGSNLAWCHPVLFQRLAAAKERNPNLKVVNIDPRRTATSELADFDIPLAPGSDATLFNGLLRVIEAEGALDADWCAANVNGLDEALETARAFTYDRVAEVTGLSPLLLARFYAAWIGAERVVTVYSQGVNQSSAGVEKVASILNCHLATGRIGRPGMGPLSVTGQPNAMGGREVGGLANMLAAHLNLEDETHRTAVQSFWASPAMAATPGLKAVDLFRACADGRIKALWIMSTNPAVSLPEADAVRAAIAATPFVAVSDILGDTDTARLADVLLPATGWGEKSGTVTNSERVISRQRPFLPAPGVARPDWRQICDVAARMGWADAFDFESPAAVFDEHARLSSVAAGLGAAFDISGLAGLSRAAYDALPPTRWPAPAPGASAVRLFAEGGFPTPDGRARLHPVEGRGLAQPTTAKRPLRLNTGRVRDHWHTMTRTARSPRLSRHIAEPYLEVHPADAARLGLAPATLAEVRSDHGGAVLRVLVTDRTPEGSVFAPMHWTGETSSAGRVDALVAAEVDPISGQPESKATPVSVQTYHTVWYGYALSSCEFRPETDYWATARLPSGAQAELAGQAAPEDWTAFARALFGVSEAAEAVAFEDRAAGLARIGFVEDGRMTAALFVAPEPVQIARAHVAAAFAEGAAPGAVLAGRPGGDRPDPGPTVCSCFEVGANAILSAVASGEATTVDAVGALLQAGTNCGSCRPEIKALIARARPPVAAE